MHASFQTVGHDPARYGPTRSSIGECMTIVGAIQLDGQGAGDLVLLRAAESPTAESRAREADQARESSPI
jgi:hypothetical protein